MDIEAVETYIQELNRDGSDLNLKYIKWKKSPMTKIVGQILYNLSTPDKCAGKLVNIPGTGEDSACAMLGYVLGRSHAVSEMLQLDDIVGPIETEVEATFE